MKVPWRVEESVTSSRPGCELPHVGTGNWAISSPHTHAAF